MSDIFNVHLKVIDTNNSTSVYGMTFARGCFRHMDGRLVPIVWFTGNLMSDVKNAIGSALLCCTDEYVYADCKIMDKDVQKLIDIHLVEDMGDFLIQIIDEENGIIHKGNIKVISPRLKKEKDGKENH